MGVFDKVLAGGESLFKNEVALSYEFMPKLITFRETQQFALAKCIKPLFNKMNGKNAIIYGLPGIGKTVATKHVLMELEEQTDDILTLYTNCWQKNTSYKIFLDMCEQLEYKFIHNKRTEELFEILKKELNKKSVVFVFDEIDKVEDFTFLYSILEEIYRKSIVCITNYKSWISSLDERIMSRLVPEHIEFPPYTKDESKGILEQRKDLAFVSGVWMEDAFSLVVSITYDLKDIRSGLYLLKESGLSAEDRSSKKIDISDVTVAKSKLQDFKIKKIDDLDVDIQQVLELIKKHSPSKIGDIFKIYQESGGTLSYKSFQRRVEKLSENKFISVKKITGGTEGSTTIIYYDSATRQLSDFK